MFHVEQFIMKEINSCIICGSNSFEPFLICKDFTVSQQDFKIVSCKHCGFKFTNPRPEDKELGKYYKSEEYVSHSDTKKGLINKLYHYVRNYTLNKKLSLVNSYVSRGTILDYGCGTGMFLSTCTLTGWKTFGLEPDEDARKLATNKNIVVFENKQQLEDQIKDYSLSVITLWHVLEHVTDMEQMLSFFERKLKKDGVLIIAVPNHLSYDAKYYKEFWAAYDVPRHLYHFEKNTVEKLLENSGFYLEETKPMKFDSFYVSMLSEKYKTGTSNLLKAFWTGLKSNIKAKTATEYSSVIYIFKKQ